jgi:hypothetical protein
VARELQIEASGGSAHVGEVRLVGQEDSRTRPRQLLEHEVQPAPALHDVVDPRDVQRGIAPLQGTHVVDQLRDAALVDAAPHEFYVRQIVMVAQDGHAAVVRPQGAERVDKTLRVELLGGVAREVARDDDEVRLLLVDLLRYPSQAFGLRPVVEVEVANLHQAVVVELRREPRQGERHVFDLHPAGLHLPRVDKAARTQERRRRGHLPA